MHDVLAAVLPTLAPIVGPSTIAMAIDGGPDLTTVDGRSTVGVDSAPMMGSLCYQGQMLCVR